MFANARIAQPGDCFILLEPDAGGVAAVRRQQHALQTRCGGTPHQRIHLTCQRFSSHEGESCAMLVERLRMVTAGLPPFPIIGVGLELRESPFWGAWLLRWLVQPSEPLCGFIEGVEQLLRAAGHDPHFTPADWKTSAHVTALDGVAPCELDTLALPAPQHLFLATYVVLSCLAPDRSFSILERIQLVSP